MLNLFEYSDFRVYLNAYYQHRKALNKKYSFRYLSKFFGFSSPNFLKLVIDGKRGLSGDSIQRITAALKLKKHEADYFDAMVRLSMATSEKEKSHFTNLMHQLTEYQRIKKLDRSYYKYLSCWYYPAIREMTLLENFIPDPAWIANALEPKITPAQAKEALTVLQELSLITRYADSFTPTGGNLATDEEIINKAARKFHTDSIINAVNSMDKTSFNWRNITSLIVAVNQKSFDETKKQLQQFIEDLNVKLSKEKTVDAIYQLNLQFFNVTKIPWTPKT